MTLRGRPPISFELARAKGRTRVNPGRFALRHAKSQRPIGKPPPHLSAEARACWSELAAASPEIAAPQRMSLELAAVMLAAYRDDPRAFTAGQVNALRAALKDIGIR